MVSLQKLRSPKVILNVWRVLQVCNFILVNRIVNTPYMDEIFHVPQAQAYCQWNFSEYDPKLTTPPGLYLISFLLHVCRLPCNIMALRGLNLVVGTTLLPDICARIYGALHPKASLSQIAWAHCFALMPLFSFFSLLYYTDVVSTYLVLGSYLLLLRGRVWTASAVSFCSLWLRQTNLVWIAAFAALHLIDRLEFVYKDERIEQSWGSSDLSGILGQLSRLLVLALQNPEILVQVILPFIPIVSFSAAFICINGSIVLGDKTMHVAGFYPIQMLYMISFCIGMSAISCLHTRSWRGFLSLWSRPVAVILTLICCIALATQKKHQHPFLLSDNRHYTFYVNKRILQTMPASVLGMTFAIAVGIFSLRIGNVKFTKVLVFAGAAILSICPSPLLEFRYYLIPFLLWRLHEEPDGQQSWLLAVEAWSWTLLHMATVALFLFKGFYWSGHGDIQRFMW